MPATTMMKRKPFGSHDVNVQRSSGDSVGASSVPSVEEALRLKRKKKKNKTLTLENDGAFLSQDSTSKTPRISNRSSKSLPPKRGARTTKQLRRLEQSMASRAKQTRTPSSQRTKSLSGSSINTTSTRATLQDSIAETCKESVSTGAKRKERGGDNEMPKKKLKQPIDETTTSAAKSHEAKHMLDTNANVARTREVQGSMDIVGTKEKVRESHDDVKSKQQEEVVTEKRRDRKVATKKTGISKDRDSKRNTSRFEPLKKSEKEIPLRRSVTLEQPTTRAGTTVESKHQVAGMDDVTMDCTSDDDSLQLSPESTSPPPVQAKVKQDKALVVKTRTDRRERPQVEYDDTAAHTLDLHPRLSMTTLTGEDVDPVQHAPKLAVDESSENLPRSMEDLLRRESTGPIVTKGMLSRARQAKADNEDVVAAMMESGPPHKRREERSPTPDASMVGTMIGHPHERSDSVDGSEVTMLTTDSSLTDFPGEHVKKKHDSKSDEKSPATKSPTEKSEVDQKASPDDVSAVPEADTSRTSKSRGRRSTTTLSSIREPEEGIDESNDVLHFEHNGVTMTHPPLPSGWVVHVSQSKQRLFYSHPDHGSTWHCPIILPKSVSDSILNLFSQPSQKQLASRNDDDTESEDSEMQDVKSNTSSIASKSSAARSNDSTHFSAKTKDVEATEDYRSDVSSLASSVVDYGERTAKTKSNDNDVEQYSPPLVDDEVVSTAQCRQVGRVTMDSTDMSSRLEVNKSDADNEQGSQTSKGSRSSHTSHSLFKSKVDNSAVSSNLDDSSPSQGVARVSLVTEKEAVTEDLSPKVVKELVSIAHFRGSNAGAVAALDMYDGSQDEEELVVTNEPREKAMVSSSGVEKDKKFLASLRGSHGDTGSLTFVSTNVDHSKAKDAEAINEDRANDDIDDFDVRDEDSVPLVEDGDAQSVDSKVGRHADDPVSTHGSSDSKSKEAQQVEEVEHVVAHHDTVGKNSEGFTVKEKKRHGDFEAEVDDVVFGIDHDDIGLSPQEERRSPIRNMHNFDKGGSFRPAETPVENVEELPTETPVDSHVSAKDDSPIMDNFDDESEPFPTETESPQKQSDTEKTGSPIGYSPAAKNNSPTYDYRSADSEQLKASPQHHQGDQLSVESPYGGATSMDDSPLTTTKWRGYSHRVLHPPHPLDSLLKIDELIKAARRRAERRKSKARSKKKKSSHKKSSSRGKQRRKTSTKLVFE